MKNLLLIIASFIFSASAFAEKACYLLSEDGASWSKTPETLCIENIEIQGQEKNEITLTTGIMFNKQTVATFVLDLLPSGANAVVYGIENPSNSIFNNLMIVIVSEKTNDYDGILEIGKNKFFFKRR